MRSLPVILVAGALLAGCLTQPREDGTALRARQLLARHHDAVVTVVGTLKVRTVVRGIGLDHVSTTPVETPGTIVDPSGTAIAGTLQLDPVGCLLHSPLRVREGGDALEMEVSSSLEGTRLRMADGTEVPARILLRDDNLNLFVLRAEPGVRPRAMPFVSLSDDVPAQPFRSCLVLSRATESFDRAPLIGRGTPISDPAGPQASCAFLTSMTAVGMPVFSTGGRLTGIGGFLFRKPDAQHPEPDQGERPVPVMLRVPDVRATVARATGTPVRETIAESLPGMAAPIEEMPVERARELFAAGKGAMVTIRGSLRFTEGSDPHVIEEDLLASGAVVTPAGHVVCGSIGARADRRYLDQRLVCVREDGMETPMRILLQDEVLSLTVLAPTAAMKPEATIRPFIPLKAGVSAEVFDDVLVMSCLGRDGGGVIAADTGKITGVSRKNGMFYLTDANPGGTDLRGSAVFLKNGRLLGMLAETPTFTRSRPPITGTFHQEIRGPQELLRIVPADIVARLVQRARRSESSR